MSEYINREDAKNAIMNCISEQTVSMYATSAECKAVRHGADIALFALDDCPTVDVVEVVRCKDCVNNDDCICVVCEEGETVLCKIMSRHVPKDFYCGKGERREK